MSKTKLSANQLAMAGYALDEEETRQTGLPTFLGPKAYSRNGRLGAFMTYNAQTGPVYQLDVIPEATYSGTEVLEFLSALGDLATPFGGAS